MEGCAKKIVAMAKEAGVVMTGAGATYPYGKDPKDSNIRIAPSFPPIDELEKAETMEAKIVHALDKMEALIQHNEADIATWLPLEYDLQMTYGEKECKADPYLAKLREVIRRI